MRFHRRRITIVDITGRDPDWGHFLEEIAAFDRETLLLNLARMSILLRNEDFASFGVQNFLCQCFVSQAQASQINVVRRQEGGQGVIIFSPQGVLCLEKLAIRYGREGGIRLESPEEKERLGRLVLNVNAFLDADSSAGPSRVSELTSLVIRQAFFNRRPQLAWAVARYWDLYVTLPSQFQTISRCDVGAAYVKAAGLSIEEVLAIGFGFMSTWLEIDVSNAGTTPIGVDPTTYLKDTKLPPEKINAALSQLGRDWEEHLAAIPVDVRSEGHWEYRFRFAQERPLIRLKSGLLVPLDLVFLVEKVTSNIFYTIFNHFSSDRQFVNAFTAKYGELFEEYVRRILKEIYGGALKHLIQGGAERGDALLFDDGVLYVFEMKSTRVLLPARVTGDIKEYGDSLSRTLFKAAEQTQTVVGLARGGKLDIHASLDHRDIRLYQPVFVFEDELPQDPTTWRWYSSELAQRGLLQGSDVARPVFLCCEELEMLEHVLKGGTNLGDIIASKTKDPACVDTSFRNFLLSGVFKRSELENTRMRERFREVHDRFKGILFEPSAKS